MIMKKILIATDFSVAAQNATDYGVRLAQAVGATVILASAFEEVPVPVTDTPLIAVPEDLRGLVQRQLELEADSFPRERAVSVEVLPCEGPASTAILGAARSMNAELIIAGMKGSGKSLRKIFGSTVTGLARRTSIPLLIIPEGVSFAPLKAIAMASDVAHETDYGIPVAVRRLADQFHSKIFVIRLFNKQAGEVIEILHQSANLNRTIGAFAPLCEIPADATVAEALKDYIAASPIDLLVMKPHPKTLPERWFLRSNTRQMIFQTDVPLLILPGEPHKNEVL